MWQVPRWVPFLTLRVILTLSVPANGKLQISYLGMQTQQVTAKNKHDGKADA
jgi:hypothetical protein